MNTFHTPVLLKEAVDFLKVESGKKYIDATLGGGGHSQEIITRGGIVLGIDQDNDALEYAKKRFEKELNNQIYIVKGNFRNIEKIANENNFKNVSGIIFDLGVSSYQLNSKSRGFSFRNNATLDMRMDQSTTHTAKDIINNFSGEQLVDMFQRYGEESLAFPIAKAIVKKRRELELSTTSDLAEIINNVYETYKGKLKINPSTKVFQAIRIYLNSELESLKISLNEGVNLLDKEGRLVVISYHSLEDRIVKLRMREKDVKTILKKPILPTFEEIRENPRARSAKLRAAQKL